MEIYSLIPELFKIHFTDFFFLRLSSHRLCVETGIWNQPFSTPFNERLCLNCNSLEDEFHFVLQCAMFNDLRVQYIPKRLWKRPSTFKFVELINTENHQILKNFACFVENAFKIRSSCYTDNICWLEVKYSSKFGIYSIFVLNCRLFIYIVNVSSFWKKYLFMVILFEVHEFLFLYLCNNVKVRIHNTKCLLWYH
jgi:hypothetical protein